jgi:hypothetical protein
MEDRRPQHHSNGRELFAGFRALVVASDQGDERFA